MFTQKNIKQRREKGDKKMTENHNVLKIHHADHGITPEHTPFIAEVVESRIEGFFIVCVEIPPNLPSLKSALYGPGAGDDPVGEGCLGGVSYENRGNRPGPSRLVKMPLRDCRRVVVCGVRKEKLSESFVITAYGTQATEPSPREWWDVSMTPAEALEAATFWCSHALASGESQ